MDVRPEQQSAHQLIFPLSLPLITYLCFLPVFSLTLPIYTSLSFLLPDSVCVCFFFYGFSLHSYLSLLSHPLSLLLKVIKFINWSFYTHLFLHFPSCLLPAFIFHVFDVVHVCVMPFFLNDQYS